MKSKTDLEKTAEVERAMFRGFVDQIMKRLDGETMKKDDWRQRHTGPAAPMGGLTSS